MLLSVFAFLSVIPVGNLLLVGRAHSVAGWDTTNLQPTLRPLPPLTSSRIGMAGRSGLLALTSMAFTPYVNRFFGAYGMLVHWERPGCPILRTAPFRAKGGILRISTDTSSFTPFSAEDSQSAGKVETLPNIASRGAPKVTCNTGNLGLGSSFMDPLPGG
jgi:hypothetical protein